MSVEIHKRIWHERPECKEPGYEFIWQRVQRERAEKHPKYLGGKFRYYKSIVPNHRLNGRDVWEMGRDKELYERKK